MRKPKINILKELSFAIFIILIFLNTALCGDTVLDGLGKSSNQNVPIHITSDRMEGYNKKNLIIFYGNVKAVRGDTTLWADRMDIFFDRVEKKVDKIVALGSVKVNQEDKNAVATKATYFENGMKILLEGNPKLWQKDDLLKGDQITLFLNEDRIVVETADAQINPNNINLQGKKDAKDEKE